MNYSLLKGQLRRSLNLVTDELTKRRSGQEGVGTTEELEFVQQELARLNYGDFPKLGPHSILPKRLALRRIASSWPSGSDLAKSVFDLIALLPPQLP